MKQAGYSFTAVFLFTLFATSSSCSQQPSQARKPEPVVYEATTACGEAAKKMLGIPADAACEMLKWRLTLNSDVNTIAAADFKLVVEFGQPKQNTRGFTAGSKTIELTGKWTTGKGLLRNNNLIRLDLAAENFPVNLSFFQPDENLLHLLNEDSSLLNGTGAWSYTLNRVDPIPASTEKFFPKPVQETKITSGTDTAGIFDGRTPCFSFLRELHGIPAAGCNLVKCRLILLQDIKTHTPASFLLYTIYVGAGDDNRYSVTGRWKLMQGTKNDPAATVYRLETGSEKNVTLTLLKADDNILFMLDNNTNHLVGDSYCSTTLNRKIN
jgi:hypothetical protein